MHRFFLPPEQCRGPVLTLSGGEARHAALVLRLRRGDAASGRDGAGGVVECRTQNVAKGAVTLDVVKKISHPPPACRITLAQAIPKGKILESIIQKATELGAARVIPLLTERVATRFEDGAAKAAKWQQVAVEAIKQCGQPWLPQIEEPIALASLLGRGERFELALVGSLAGDGRHPREYFDAERSARGRGLATICLWIGPEGDFTAGELEAIRASGARPITMGPLVLRSETAAIHALSIARYETERVS